MSPQKRRRRGHHSPKKAQAQPAARPKGPAKKNPHARAQREHRSLTLFLQSPVGIETQNEARKYPNNPKKHQYHVPYYYNPTEIFWVAHIHLHVLREDGLITGEKHSVWFDEHNNPDTAKLYIPKCETNANLTVERVSLIASRVGYAMAMTAPTEDFKDNPLRYYISQARKFINTNVEDYLPNGNSPEWNEFKKKVAWCDSFGAFIHYLNYHCFVLHNCILRIVWFVPM